MGAAVTVYYNTRACHSVTIRLNASTTFPSASARAFSAWARVISNSCTCNRHVDERRDSDIALLTRRSISSALYGLGGALAGLG